MATTVNSHITSIVKIINDLACYGYGMEALFRDWCEMYALAIANSCDLIRGEEWDKREQRYKTVTSKYKKVQEDRKDGENPFTEMSAHLVEAFEIEPFNDHLGRVYMELFGGDKNLGQCFTPMPICRMMAMTNVHPVSGEVRTCADEACGGGAMLIAACEVYHNAHVNYQRWLKCYAKDLDTLCVHMCYIQLSLIGARAEVVQGDTLAGTVNEVWYTPMEVLRLYAFPSNDLGEVKPDADNTDEATEAVRDALELETETVPDADEPADVPSGAPQKPKRNKAKQQKQLELSFFS